MIAPDFKPKNEEKMCEECIHNGECPMKYICPTLKRIFDEDLLDKLIGEQESDE